MRQMFSKASNYHPSIPWQIVRNMHCIILSQGCNMYLHGKFASPPYLDKTQIYDILRAADATILERRPPFN